LGSRVRIPSPAPFLQQVGSFAKTGCASRPVCPRPGAIPVMRGAGAKARNISSRSPFPTPPQGTSADTPAARPSAPRPSRMRRAPSLTPVSIQLDEVLMAPVDHRVEPGRLVVSRAEVDVLAGLGEGGGANAVQERTRRRKNWASLNTSLTAVLHSISCWMVDFRTKSAKA
jgi:hypothetical protein